MNDKGGAGAHAAQARIEFLDRELDLCQTFLDVAETEAGEAQNEAAAKRNALQGYQTVRAWIGTVRDGQEYERLSAKLECLRQRLEGT